jgi:hypothetical protein
MDLDGQLATALSILVWDNRKYNVPILGDFDCIFRSETFDIMSGNAVSFYFFH